LYGTSDQALSFGGDSGTEGRREDMPEATTGAREDGARMGENGLAE
jgi:hypothetical protein